jgi:hypothetical protein
MNSERSFNDDFDQALKLGAAKASAKLRQLTVHGRQLHSAADLDDLYVGNAERLYGSGRQRKDIHFHRATGIQERIFLFLLV